MRARLSSRELSSNKLYWWRRGGDEVADMYQELFPGTWLPRIRQFVFWLFLACAFVALIFILWKSS
jgi:hypothetical protein